MLSLLWCGFSPWPVDSIPGYRNSQKKKKKKKKKKENTLHQKHLHLSIGECFCFTFTFILALHTEISTVVCFLFVCLFVFCLFAFSRAAPVAHSCSQARGLIRTASATYTAAHGKAGSLTHRTRPGIEPATSCS